MWRSTAIEWVFAHRATLVPIAAAVDVAAWTALIYLGWHYFNCAEAFSSTRFLIGG
jgi:hypothetical protein